MGPTYVEATPTQTAKTVTTSSSVVSAAPASWRRGCILQNDSDTAIYVMFGATAVANQGVRLNANGSSLEVGEDKSLNFQGVIYAIHAGTGDKTLLVTEW